MAIGDLSDELVERRPWYNTDFVGVIHDPGSGKEDAMVVVLGGGAEVVERLYGIAFLSEKLRRVAVVGSSPSFDFIASLQFAVVVAATKIKIVFSPSCSLFWHLSRSVVVDVAAIVAAHSIRVIAVTKYRDFGFSMVALKKQR